MRAATGDQEIVLALKELMVCRETQVKISRCSLRWGEAHGTTGTWFEGVREGRQQCVICSLKNEWELAKGCRGRKLTTLPYFMCTLNYNIFWFSLCTLRSLSLWIFVCLWAFTCVITSSWNTCNCSQPLGLSLPRADTLCSQVSPRDFVSPWRLTLNCLFMGAYRPFLCYSVTSERSWLGLSSSLVQS